MSKPKLNERLYLLLLYPSSLSPLFSLTSTLPSAEFVCVFIATFPSRFKPALSDLDWGRPREDVLHISAPRVWTMFSKPLQLQKATGTSHFSMRTATALSAHSLQFFRAVDKDTGAAGRGTCTRTRTLLSPVCVRRPPPHRPPFTLSFSLPSVWLSGLRTPDSGLSTRTHFHSLKPLACYLAIELITDTTSVPTLDSLSPESWSLHSLFYFWLWFARNAFGWPSTNVAKWRVAPPSVLHSSFIFEVVCGVDVDLIW